MKKLMKLNFLLPMLKESVQESVLQILKDSNLSTETIEVKRSADARDVLKLEEGSRTALQYVSTRTLDRDKEIMITKGAVFTQFKKSNMQVFWNHDYNQLIGSDDSIEVDDFGVKALTRYAKHEDHSARANITWELKQQGHLKTNSIGFGILAYTQPGHNDYERTVRGLTEKYPKEAKSIEEANRIITKYMVLEHSDVGLPSNVDATTIALAKNYTTDEDIEKMFNIEIKDFPTGDPKVIKDAKPEPKKKEPEKKEPKETPKPIVKRAITQYNPEIKLIGHVDSEARLKKIIQETVKDSLDLYVGRV